MVWLIISTPNAVISRASAGSVSVRMYGGSTAIHAASTHRDSGEQAASSKGCRPVELQIIPVDLIGLSLHAFPAQS